MGSTLDASAATVDGFLADYARSPVDVMGTGWGVGEVAYLRGHRDSYVRTVRDVLALQAHRVLEIGALFGAVSVPLRRMGLAVSALEHPAIQASPALQAFYRSHGVRFAAADLTAGCLPYPDAAFDAVVCCEVLEHLPGNPLPALREMHRVLAPGGSLYLGTPNHAYLAHRLRLLTGRSVHDPIDYFTRQLDPTDFLSVGIHWREYTAAELRALVESAGFTVTRAAYFTEGAGRWWLRPLRALAFAVPSFRPYQVVVARRA